MNTRTKPARLAMPDFTQRCHQRGPEALIEVFRNYGLIPDEQAEIRFLSGEAAALIRSCGYPARAGQTVRCPLLPDEHVRGYPVFEHLTDAEWWVRRWGFGPLDWNPKRAIYLPRAYAHPPFSAPKDFHNMYKEVDVPALRPPDLQRKPNFFEAIRRTRRLNELNDSDFRTMQAIYLGMISYSDWMRPCERHRRFPVFAPRRMGRRLRPGGEMAERHRRMSRSRAADCPRARIQAGACLAGNRGAV